MDQQSVMRCYGDDFNSDKESEQAATGARTRQTWNRYHYEELLWKCYTTKGGREDRDNPYLVCSKACPILQPGSSGPTSYLVAELL
jgi:hypothetical protein